MNCAINPISDAAAEFAARFSANKAPVKTVSAALKQAESPVWQGNETLPCAARIDTTHDSATFVFAPRLSARFAYQPGQFVIIGVDIDGKKHHRAYSMSSSPSRPHELAITVKRVPGGLVSNYLLDHAQVGHPFHITAPAGEFYFDTNQVPDKVVLLSAGSGITPMMSISRWLLDQNHATQIHFVHSAQSERDVMFRDELTQLATRHTNFHLHLFLLEPSQQAPSQSGLLTPERLTSLLPDTASAHIYLCGPQGYMDMVESWRITLPPARAISDAHFHKESFAPAPSVAIDLDGASFELSVPGFGKQTSIQSGQTLLDALEKEGLPIIGACRSGVCGSCKCTITQGSVDSTSTATLTPENIAKGVVLACSSMARSHLEVRLGG